VLRHGLLRFARNDDPEQRDLINQMVERWTAPR